MIKKYLIPAVVVAFLLIGARILVFPQKTAPAPSSVSEITQPNVVLVIDNGEKVATYSGILATTPFGALSAVSTKESIPLQTKSYDFGVFVESINGIKGTADRAWIYFVNGISGVVAADTYELYTGDVVEWKYVKPQESL